jgi:hypothetical protein
MIVAFVLVVTHGFEVLDLPWPFGDAHRPQVFVFPMNWELW